VKNLVVFILNVTMVLYAPFVQFAGQISRGLLLRQICGLSDLNARLQACETELLSLLLLLLLLVQIMTYRQHSASVEPRGV